MIWTYVAWRPRTCYNGRFQSLKWNISVPCLFFFKKIKEKTSNIVDYCLENRQKIEKVFWPTELKYRSYDRFGATITNVCNQVIRPKHYIDLLRAKEKYSKVNASGRIESSPIRFSLINFLFACFVIRTRHVHMERMQCVWNLRTVRAWIFITPSRSLFWGFSIIFKVKFFVNKSVIFFIFKMLAVKAILHDSL